MCKQSPYMQLAVFVCKEQFNRDVQQQILQPCSYIYDKDSHLYSFHQ